MSRGFSMIEVMVSMAIIVTSILLVALIFSGVLNASQKSADTTTGVLVARSKLSEVLAGVLGNAPAKANFFLGIPATFSGIENVHGTDYKYQIYHYDVDPTDIFFGAPAGTRLQDTVSRIVHIQVTWSEMSDFSRQGQGILRVSLMRMVSFSDKS